MRGYHLSLSPAKSAKPVCICDLPRAFPSPIQLRDLLCGPSECSSAADVPRRMLRDPLSTGMEARGSFGPGTVAVWLLRPLFPYRSRPVEPCFLSPPRAVLSLSLLFFVLFTFSALSCSALHLQE